MKRTDAAPALVTAVLLLALAGCAEEEVEEPFTPSASHSAYAEGLEKMNMAETEMGRRWLRQAEQALESPVEVELPYSERGFFDPARPEAWGYRFTVERGRKVIVELSLPSETGEAGELKLFADIFRKEGDGGQEEIHHVASYSEEQNEIRFETLRENSYVLRIQPELLRGGRFSVSIRHEPLLSFPVEGADMADIHSFFGDPRDGGSRRHEGVDIFAPRGTPILAVTDARVRRVGTRDLGGRIVLLWDEERQLHYYYAHLEEQIAEEGSRVQPGDVLGTVGNSGNARTTPPHLHFGVYRRWFDALDPWSFLDPPSKPVPEPAKTAGQLDSWMVLMQEVALTEVSSPVHSEESYEDSGGAGTDEMPLSLAGGTPLRIVGSSARYVRALLPSGDGHALLPAEHDGRD